MTMYIWVFPRVLICHKLSMPNIKIELAFINLTKVNMLILIINQCEWIILFAFLVFNQLFVCIEGGLQIT